VCWSGAEQKTLQQSVTFSAWVPPGETAVHKREKETQRWERNGATVSGGSLLEGGRNTNEGKQEDPKPNGQYAGLACYVETAIR